MLRKLILPLLLLACALPASAQRYPMFPKAHAAVLPSASQISLWMATWFVRADGGTRYSSNVTSGQCNGTADVAYPGSGTNQNCAFNDIRYLWSDNSGAANAWLPVGGDTMVIRGCHALANQTNPDNPHCRLGDDTPNAEAPPNQWCGTFGTAHPDCYNPTIPAGTSSQHTRILGGCAYDGNCSGGQTNPKLYASNLTQLFGGFGLIYTLNFQSTQYVDFEGFEVTTHNGICSTSGTPKLGGGCATSEPYSDFAVHGIRTDNTTSHVLFQDVYIHGMNGDGMQGPIGGPISYLRTFIGFNTLAGINYDDGVGTPDASGSTISYIHTIFEGNGCQEEYPITHAFPCARAYDDNSSGFGDATSGQNTVLDALTANDYQALYNTKDGFIGPHTWITNVNVQNSISAFNMGASWKWGSASVPTTAIFENNLTVAGCQRMQDAIAGAPSGYNTYLSDFCRAAGDVISNNISAGSGWTFANNSFVVNSPTLLDIQCPNDYPVCTGATINWFNNIVLGYANIPTVYGTNTPGIFYNTSPSDISIICSHDVEFGTRNGCDSGATITDPLFANEPAQSVTVQNALDVFTNVVNTSSFYPSGASPLIHGGTTGGPATDYFGVTQTSPATIGAVVSGGTPTAGGSVSCAGSCSLAGSVTVGPQ